MRGAGSPTEIGPARILGCAPLDPDRADASGVTTQSNKIGRSPPVQIQLVLAVGDVARVLWTLENSLSKNSMSIDHSDLYP